MALTDKEKDILNEMVIETLRVPAIIIATMAANRKKTDEELREEIQEYQQERLQKLQAQKEAIEAKISKFNIIKES